MPFWIKSIEIHGNNYSKLELTILSFRSLIKVHFEAKISSLTLFMVCREGSEWQEEKWLFGNRKILKSVYFFKNIITTNVWKSTFN